MRLDSKWRIVPSKTQRLKPRHFWSGIFMILLASSVLLGVYLFSLYDQRSISDKFQDNYPVSIEISQFQPVLSPPESIKATSPKEKKSIQKILEDLNITSSTFVLAQLDASGEEGTLYTTSTDFYKLISHVFQSYKKEPLSLETFPEEATPTPELPSDLPFHKYSQPFENKNNIPQVSLAILKLDPDSAETQQSLDMLPKEIALSYLPYGNLLSSTLQIMRHKGYEVLLMIPLEPLDYPENDAGTDSLLTGLDPQDNLDRLTRHLQHSEGIIGVTNFMGSRFALSKTDIRVFLKALSEHGLMMLETTSQRSLMPEMAQEIDLPFAHTALQIDDVLSKEDIEAKLHILEQQALMEGKAVGYGFGNNLTLEIITTWTKTLFEKGILLAPLSSYIRKK